MTNAAHCLMGVALLPAVLFADLPTAVYVVPTGTVGNAPTAPYSTWMTAANAIRPAANEVAAHGFVMIASGDYSGDAVPRLAPEKAVSVAIVDGSGSTAPGEITVGSPLFGYANDNDDPDKHALTIKQGTVKVTSSAANLFSEGTADGGSKGKRANFHLTLTGANTHLELPSQGFYCGYNCAGTTIHVTDGATVNALGTYLGQLVQGDGTAMTVDDGASVTNKNDFRVGDVANNCSLTVSNAFVKSGTVYVGSASTNSGVRLTLAGAVSPAYYSTSVINFRPNATFEINVADAPLAGYRSDRGFAYIAGWNFHETSRIVFSGLERLRDRLRAAGIKTFQSKLLCQYNGQAFAFPDAVWHAAVTSMSSVRGFALRKEGPWVHFSYDEQGEDHTYVVEAGTAGNTPTEFYGTWATAANAISNAVQYTATNGTVTIASGTYVEPSFMGGRAVTIEAVTSPTDDSAGAVSLGDRFFGNGTVPNASKDPMVNSLTLSKGAFTMNVDASDGAFVEYVSSGWDSERNCRLLITGADTTLSIAKNGGYKPFYAGYTTRGTETTVADGAQVIASTLYVGLLQHAANSGMYILNGGQVSIQNSVRIGELSDGCFVVISNGTLRAGAFSLGKAGVPHGERLTLAGTNALVTCTSSFTANGNARVVFDVAAAPLEGYATAPLQAGNVTWSEDAVLEIAGAEQMLARQDAAPKARRTKLTLAEAKGGTLAISAVQLATAQAVLPEFAELSAADNKRVLKIGRPRCLVINMR